MTTFRFLDFPVYIQGKVVYKRILLITEKLNNYSLKDQIRRAALSVLLNVAEGSAKKSDREFSRFLQLSLGSVNEVVACLDIMMDNKLISNDDFNKLNNECKEIARQLGGLFKKLTVNR